METTPLTISEICMYLPYGLQMMNTKNGRIIDVRGLRDTVSSFIVEATVKKGNDFVDEDYQFDLWPLKPMLIPLSQLTKEDWIEVFKAGLITCDLNVRDYVFKWRVGEVEICVEDESIIAYNCYCRSFYSDLKFNQHAAFQKLYSLHADINDLIGQSKAICKLEVTK